MLRMMLALRLLLLLPALGAAVGALLMILLGGAKLLGAMAAFLNGQGAGSVMGAVMAATDSFLFSMVLFVFASAITFNFALDPCAEDRARMPRWINVGGIGSLKRTLLEVVLVFLVVDFATDAVGSDEPLGWTSLVLPLAVVLIALAIRLWPHGEERS